MNIKLPKDILALTAEIRAKREAIEQHRKDIDRAGEAAREAERLDGEIQALSDRRARVKAEAFIAGTKADIAELDRQETELEKASRRAREDGKAGALAVQLLEEKITEAEMEIAQLEDGRKTKTLEWLTAQREKAVDLWLDALSALGPIVADALAFESARRQLDGRDYRGDDVFKNANTLVYGLPNPRGTWEEQQYSGPRWVPAPIDWVADQEHGKLEREQLIGALEEVEVL